MASDEWDTAPRGDLLMGTKVPLYPGYKLDQIDKFIIEGRSIRPGLALAKPMQTLEGEHDGVKLSGDRQVGPGILFPKGMFDDFDNQTMVPIIDSYQDGPEDFQDVDDDGTPISEVIDGSLKFYKHDKPIDLTQPLSLELPFVEIGSAAGTVILAAMGASDEQINEYQEQFKAGVKSDLDVDLDSWNEHANSDPDDSNPGARSIHFSNVKNPLTIDIINNILPDALDLYIAKSEDYGNTADTLGAQGQFADIWRKIGKLKRFMWDGVQPNFEGSEEILKDILGHTLLSLHYLRNNKDAK